MTECHEVCLPQSKKTFSTVLTQQVCLIASKSATSMSQLSSHSHGASFPINPSLFSPTAGLLIISISVYLSQFDWKMFNFPIKIKHFLLLFFPFHPQQSRKEVALLPIEKHYLENLQNRGLGFFLTMWESCK